jgi:hypothetical protein
MARTTKAAPNKVNGKAAPERKDNRYLRAFRLIGDDATITADTIAKRAGMSVSMAVACIVAWNAAVQVIEGRNALAVKTSDLMNNTKGGAVPTVLVEGPSSEDNPAAAEAKGIAA